ncbi:MAG: cell division protein SepF [Lachnospiraceae bacterium]
MSLIDGLIRGMKFNSDPEDDDIETDDVYDDDDGYEQPARGGRKMLNFPGKGRPTRDRDEEDEEYEDERPSAGNRSVFGAGSRQPAAAAAPATVPQPSRRRQAPATGNMQVRVIKPSSFDQARQITDTLLSHRTVLLNLEGLDVNTAQRIVDFASGSCYALRGNFMKISHFIIVITPEDVDIAGDITGDSSQDPASAMAMGAMAGAAASMANQNPAQGGYGQAAYAGPAPRYQAN